MGKYKYRLGNGLAFNEDKDLIMMERMAAKGYKPVGAYVLGFYRFVKAFPEEVDYSMDISDLEPGTEDFNNYREIFQSGGWEHVFSMETKHIFKARKGTTPIYTDKRNKSEKHRNMLMISLKSALLFAAMTVLFMTIRYLPPLLQFKTLIDTLMGASLGLALGMTVSTVINWVRVVRSR